MERIVSLQIEKLPEGFYAVQQQVSSPNLTCAASSALVLMAQLGECCKPRGAILTA